MHISTIPYICQFENCGSVWAGQMELTWHIEKAHIPLIKKKYNHDMANAKSDEERRSILKKLEVPGLLMCPIGATFETDPKPIEFSQYTVTFDHYRKNPFAQAESATIRANNNAMQVRKTIANVMHEMGDVKLNEGRPRESDNAPSTPLIDSAKNVDEKKVKCKFEGCNKRYKNMQGYRQHVKICHSESLAPKTELAEGESSIDSSVFDDIVAKNGSMELKKQTESAIPTYKCKDCSKVYKTQQGLQNHVNSTHSQPTINQKLVSKFAMDPMSREESPLSPQYGPPPAKQQKMVQRTTSGQVPGSYQHPLAMTHTIPKHFVITKPSEPRDSTKAFMNFEKTMGPATPIPSRPSTMGMNVVNKNQHFGPAQHNSQQTQIANSTGSSKMTPRSTEQKK